MLKHLNELVQLFMETCGKNWNEYNGYIVGPKALLKHCNQCFSLFKWLEKKLVQWFETNNFNFWLINHGFNF